MEELEERALAPPDQVTPTIWGRHVGNVFFIVRKEKTDWLLRRINSMDKNIRFTIEREANGQLPFLDALVARSENGLLRTAVYAKPTHTGQVLHFASNHSVAAKRAVVKTMLGRIALHY